MPFFGLPAALLSDNNCSLPRQTGERRWKATAGVMGIHPIRACHQVVGAPHPSTIVRRSRHGLDTPCNRRLHDQYHPRQKRHVLCASMGQMSPTLPILRGDGHHGILHRLGTRGDDGAQVCSGLQDVSFAVERDAVQLSRSRGCPPPRCVAAG